MNVRRTLSHMYCTVRHKRVPFYFYVFYPTPNKSDARIVEWSALNANVLDF